MCKLTAMSIAIGVEVEPGLMHAGDSSPGFLHHEARRGHVPGVQVELPEPVEASGGHVADVQAAHPVRRMDCAMGSTLM